MSIDEDLKALKTVGLAGSDYILVPLGNYVDLLHKQRQLAEHQADSQIIMGRAGTSLLDRNPDVAYFFIQNFGRYSMADLLKKCRRLFGASKTPSRSAAYRYWDKVREAQKGCEAASK